MLNIFEYFSALPICSTEMLGWGVQLRYTAEMLGWDAKLRCLAEMLQNPESNFDLVKPTKCLTIPLPLSKLANNIFTPATFTIWPHSFWPELLGLRHMGQAPIWHSNLELWLGEKKVARPKWKWPFFVTLSSLQMKSKKKIYEPILRKCNFKISTS